MLSCRRARRLLSPYLDGALSERERRAVEEHLSLCSACRLELERLKKAMAALRLHGPRAAGGAEGETAFERAWERARLEAAEPEAVPASVWAKLALSGAVSLLLLMWGAHMLASRAFPLSSETRRAATAAAVALPASDIESLPDEKLQEMLRPFGGRLAMLSGRKRTWRPAGPRRPRSGEEGASMLPRNAPKAAKVKQGPAVEIARFRPEFPDFGGVRA